MFTMIAWQDVLFWCSVINVVLLLASVLLYRSMRNLAHRLHGKWFHLSSDKMDAIVYAMLGFYKICIIVFNIVPYIALRIVG